MKNILLIGTGRFGRHIAVQLYQLGHQVMAVDTNEERISDVLPYVTNAQIGDSTNAEFLRSPVSYTHLDVYKRQGHDCCETGKAFPQVRQEKYFRPDARTAQAAVVRALSLIHI